MVYIGKNQEEILLNKKIEAKLKKSEHPIKMTQGVHKMLPN
jgi:hypothetical protein